MIAALFCVRLRSVRVRCVLRKCDVHFGGRCFERKLKSARHDSDDGVRMALNAQCAANRGLIAIKEPHPQIVSENDLESSRSAAGLFILANKRAADRRLHAEDIEEFRADL